MAVTLIILAVAAVFFVNGKIRSDIVALCALVLLVLFQILTPDEALTGFSNSIVIMMIGLFVVGGGIFKTGLAKMISNKLLKLAGNSQVKLYFVVMIATAVIGAFVSNTGTVALMLPVVVSLAMSANISSSRLLMPLAFASSMGGMLTLIGTPPNLVINNTLIAAGYEGLSFFTFLPVGLVCITLGVLALWPLSKLFLSKKSDTSKNTPSQGRTLSELANKYQLADDLFRLRVTKSSDIRDKKLMDLNIATTYNVNVLEIRRKPAEKKPFMKSINQKIAAADTIFEEDDIVYVKGSFEDVKSFSEKNHLILMDSHDTEEAPVFGGKLRFDEIGIAELVILSNSNLINKKVKNTGFRNKYNVNILGIQRHDENILHDVKDEKIQAGDVLLVQGEWKNIDTLNEEQENWVVVGQPLEQASKISLDHKAPLAGIIMIGMVICMAFNIVAPVTAVMVAALVMVLTGCFRNVEEAYHTINWESIVLIAAMLPMSLALEKTGTATLISDSLTGSLGNYSPYVLLGAIYFATSILTLFISNTATAVLFSPIALYAALGMGLSPYPFLFAVAVAASMCFASPFSTPPNALVMSAGRYTFTDYVKVGLPLQILFGIVMIFILPLIFSF